MVETYYATITSKGQITVPKAVREAMAVKAGDKVAFELCGDEIHIYGVSTDFEDIIGSIKPLRDIDPGDFDELIEEAWGQAALERWLRVLKQ